MRDDCGTPSLKKKSMPQPCPFPSLPHAICRNGLSACAFVNLTKVVANRTFAKPYLYPNRVIIIHGLFAFATPTVGERVIRQISCQLFFSPFALVLVFAAETTLGAVISISRSLSLDGRRRPGRQNLQLLEMQEWFDPRLNAAATHYSVSPLVLSFFFFLGHEWVSIPWASPLSTDVVS
jgi:hypothetical protein